MNRRLKVKRGEQYAELTVTRTNGSDKKTGKRRYKCRCSCGRYCDATATDLISGKKKSCGHLRAESARRRQFSHGMAGSPTYVSWQNMLNRCRNRNVKSYKDYGALGVSVCARWHSFANFLDDMGERPDGMSLDRIDVFGNYEPKNCRWATRSEQARNTRGAAALKILAKMQAAK